MICYNKVMKSKSLQHLMDFYYFWIHVLKKIMTKCTPLVQKLMQGAR